MASAPNYLAELANDIMGFTHDPLGYAITRSHGVKAFSDAKGPREWQCDVMETSASICKTLRHATSPVAYRRYRGMVSVNLR